MTFYQKAPIFSLSLSTMRRSLLLRGRPSFGQIPNLFFFSPTRQTLSLSRYISSSSSSFVFISSFCDCSNFRCETLKKSSMAPPILSLALSSETGRVLSIQSHTVQVFLGYFNAARSPNSLLFYNHIYIFK